MAMLCTISIVRMRIDMIMLVFMLMRVAVNLLAMPVWMIMEMLMAMTMLMPVLDFNNLARTGILVTECQQIKRLHILIGEEFCR